MCIHRMKANNHAEDSSKDEQEEKYLTNLRYSKDPLRILFAERRRHSIASTK
jgi:hypothetical protein